MRLGDLDALKDYAFEIYHGNGVELETLMVVPLAEIDNAPTVVNEYTKGFADGERSGRNFPLTDEEKAILVRQWQPQGEWYYSCQNGWHCSICHESVKDMPTVMRKAIFNFCPNCGASMMKGGENHE